MIMTSAEEDVTVEILAFANPDNVDCKLFLPRVPWRGESAALEELLHQTFSPFGLLHSVFAKESSTSPGLVLHSLFLF